MTESQAGKKVLIIDDEESVVLYIKTLLEDNGYQTVTAGDGEEGLQKARAEKPDLVTLDMSMPKKSGVGFYRTLREDAELKEIKVVVVTGVTGFGGKSEDFQKFLATRKQVPPPDAFVAKPFEEKDFLETVAKLLG